jgi:fluoroacetyl-CoA thioesterase
MKNILKPGDITTYKWTVSEQDVAAFEGEVVHPVCSTFSLAREVEWTTRQFVLSAREEDEEGIGTHLTIDHKRPAFVGEEILIQGRVEKIEGHHLICSFEAHVGTKLVAVGKTGQKILKKEKIDKLLNNKF